MAADPADRFASAEVMAKALRRFAVWPTATGVVAGFTALVLAVAVVTSLVHRTANSTPAPFPSPTPSPRKPDPVPSPPLPAALSPMKGRIDLLVVKSKDGTRRRLRLADRNSLPVRADDEIRIEARLDRPAYVYLFWLGSEGKVAPLYPWRDHDWSTRPSQERKVTGAEVPEILDDILEIPHSAPGWRHWSCWRAKTRPCHVTRTRIWPRALSAHRFRCPKA
jgi:hypothetical protein